MPENRQEQGRNRETTDRLIERLGRTGVAGRVITDKDEFGEKAKELGIDGQEQDMTQLKTDDGVLYGLVINGDVYLNPDVLDNNTTIHENAVRSVF